MNSVSEKAKECIATKMATFTTAIGRKEWNTDMEFIPTQMVKGTEI